MDETDGLRYDTSRNGNHLTAHNVVAIPGQAGQAADLEENKYAYLSIDNTLQSGLTLTGSLSLAGWLQAETLDTDYRSIIGKYNATSEASYRLYLPGRDTLKFFLSDDGTSGATLEATTPLTPGEWYHVVAVFDAATQNMALYLDGNLEAERTVSFSQLHPSAALFMLGAYDNQGVFVHNFDGLLDDWRVYDRALNPTAIEALVNNYPVAAFSSDPDQGLTPLTVTFSNKSLNAITSTWHFGDGTFMGTDQGQVTKVYPISGIYTVSLTAGNGLLSDTLTVHQAIVAGRQAIDFVEVGDEWSYFKGTTAPSATWTLPHFDTSNWLSGPSGLGYGDGDDATELTDMKGNYVTLFARRVFTLSNEIITDLELEIDYDDGFVAYLNGTAVVTSNVNDPAFGATASGLHEAGSPVIYDLSDKLYLLQAGPNVLAVQGHNEGLYSSDFSLLPALWADIAPGN